MEPDDYLKYGQSLSGRKTDRMAIGRATRKRNGQGHMSDITEIDKWRDNRLKILTLAGHRTQCPRGFVIVTHHNIPSIKHIQDRSWTSVSPQIDLAISVR
jgi:hypothetical protein